MANDVELRRLANAINELTKATHIQNKILDEIRKELKRGNEEAASRGSGLEEGSIPRGGEAAGVGGPGGGSGEAEVQPGTPPSGEQSEAFQEPRWLVVCQFCTHQGYLRRGLDDPRCPHCGSAFIAWKERVS